MVMAKAQKKQFAPLKKGDCKSIHTDNSLDKVLAMNLVKGIKPIPLRVLMVNPLAPASQMIIMKILSGSIFGNDELIDLALLVYVNEVEAAEALKLALDACAYSKSNSIIVSSQLPNITDADVFCFITNFPNPNFIDFENFDNDAAFDSFYLLLKIAHNFSLQPPPVEKPPEEDLKVHIKKRKIHLKKMMKPIFMTDGLVSLDILSSFSKRIPAADLFCPTSLAVIAKSVLGEYLKVNCDVINDILVYAANDSIFHVDLVEPCLTHDNVDMSAPQCTWKKIGKNVMDSLSLDHTQFNASWLKKEYIELIRDVASRNPYGSISKASEFSKALRGVWNYRIYAKNTNSNNKKAFDNFGVISDGSLGTMKVAGLISVLITGLIYMCRLKNMIIINVRKDFGGLTGGLTGYCCPYVLPVLITGDTWNVDKRFEETLYLKYEMKRMNKAVKQHHTKLMNYCEKFLDENVIHQAFVQKEDESSTFSMEMTTTSPRPTSDTIADSLSPCTSINTIQGPKPSTPKTFFAISRSSDVLN